MTTWILAADQDRAWIFQKSSPERKPILHHEIARPTPAILRRAARELDLACAAGTDSQLEIYGDEPVLARILPLLSSAVRQRLVGAFSRKCMSCPAL